MSVLVREASNDTYVEAELPDTIIVKVGTATLCEDGEYDNPSDWDFPFTDEHLFPMDPEFCAAPKEMGEDDDRFWQFCLDEKGRVSAHPVDSDELEVFVRVPVLGDDRKELLAIYGRIAKAAKVRYAVETTPEVEG